MSESCFVWAAPSLLISPLLYNIALGSWDSNPARVNASEKFQYLVCILKIFILLKNERNSILRNSGYTWLLRWNWVRFTCQSKLDIFCLYLCIEMICQRFSFIFVFLYRVFFTSKKYALKISYNRNPVKPFNWCDTKCVTRNII
jgi:hypothetical protein